MPLGEALLLRRLGRVCTSDVRAHQSYRQIYTLVKLYKPSCYVRTLSGDTRGNNGSEGENSNPSPPTPSLTPRHRSLLQGRRPLSPLERVSRLLPQESLSPEVTELRNRPQDESGGGQHDTGVPSEHNTAKLTATGHHGTQAYSETYIKNSALAAEDVWGGGPETQEHDTLPLESVATTTPTLHGERPLTFGELLIAEYHKKKRVEFRKMFQLHEGARLQSAWGIIAHDNMEGKPPGCFLKTNLGIPIFLRRASLEDYVLYMKRGPAIAYPKDASIMLLQMDITEGDCVLESGSGSGAMSLFLSRAVGSKGCVLSLEIRADHHRRAVLNYERWRQSWILRRGEEWPNNIHFHHADICTDFSLLAGRGFNSVALDMMNPHLALPAVLPHLHPGGVCAIYLANITQVTDLLEGLRCFALPLLCERIIEVPVRDWLVVPATQKDGRFYVRKAGNLVDDQKVGNEEEEAELADQTHQPFGSVPYIARPHPEQMSHTAFLVKLRKCVL